MRKTSKFILIAAVSIVVSSPAFAIVCTATDDAGKQYREFRVNRSLAIKAAMQQCQAKSDAPNSCKILSCGAPS